MKTKLEVGKEYWLSEQRVSRGIFLGENNSGNFDFRITLKSKYTKSLGELDVMVSNLSVYSEYTTEKPLKFITPIVMKCTEDQFNGINDKLVEMGYKTKHITFCSDTRYIVTCYGNEINLISDLNLTAIETSQTKRINIGSFNPDLFLALAAMTDKEDGIKGEWWMSTGGASKLFTVGSIYKQCKDSICDWKSILDNRNTENGYWSTLDCFRKATAQEIIKNFEEKEFVLPEYWHVLVTEENVDVLSKWRFERDYPKFKLKVGHITGFSSWKNSKQHNPANGVISFGSEITFDQFKKYVLKETGKSCHKSITVGSIEFTVNLEFDSEAAAEEIFAKIVELSAPPYESKIKEVSERTIKAITDHFVKDNNRLRSSYAVKDIQEVWNESIGHVKGNIAIHIPSSKQATLFDDRVEITDWMPVLGEKAWQIFMPNYEFSAQQIIFKNTPYHKDLFELGFIKRTESEAKQLVEKLKQATI